MEEIVSFVESSQEKKQTEGIDVHRQLGCSVQMWKSLITAVAPQLHDGGWQGGALLADWRAWPVWQTECVWNLINYLLPNTLTLQASDHLESLEIDQL